MYSSTHDSTFPLTSRRRDGLVAFPRSEGHPPNETPARIHVANPRGRHVPVTGVDTPLSVMRGVVLTDTGEMIPTPAPHPVELARLVLDSPRVGLNFGGIFDGHKDYEEDSEDGDGERGELAEIASPSARRMLVLEQKERERKQAQEREKEREKENVSPIPSTMVTRLRKPSTRATRPSLLPSIASCPAGLPGNTNAQHPLVPASQSVPPATYDLNDDENLPSPFLKRTDLAKAHARRGSTAHDLRAKAAANAAISTSKKMTRIVGSSSGQAVARPSLERAKQASEDAKKALFRP